MIKTSVKIQYTKKPCGLKRFISFLKHGRSLENDTFLLGIFYTLMYGGILLIPHAIFWDDWTLYRNPPNVVLGIFKQLGAMFNSFGYLHVLMLSIGTWNYKILTFLLMFISGLLLNSILERNALLSKENRFFVVLLFLILPFNFARVALIVFPYTLCYFFFFLAWRLIYQHRVIALLLFFLSFNTNSLLVFYFLPMLDLLYLDSHLKNPRSFLLFAYRRLDFLLLPFLFFFIKTQFFPPSGLYAGYNQNYNLLHIPPAIKEQYEDLKAVAFDFNFYIFLILTPFIALILRKKIDAMSQANHISWYLLGALGTLAFILGAFPYWILGLIPSFHEWTSRNQLLLPLGSALIIIAVLCPHKKLFKTIGITNYYSFFIDWNKQKALIELFSNNSVIKNSKLVIITDETNHLNAIKRSYRFYEWNGLLEQAYGNQNHFVITPEDTKKYQEGGFDKYFSSYYKANGHQRNEMISIVFVKIKQDKKHKPGDLLSNKIFPKFTLSTKIIHTPLSTEIDAYQ